MTTDKTIWKYTLGYDYRHIIDMPAGASVRHFAMQGTAPTLWALVDPSAEIVKRTFAFYTDLEAVPENDVYIGTAQTPPQWGQSAGTALHLFEVLTEAAPSALSDAQAVDAALDSFILGGK
jgi:hypothetical protein